MFDGRWRQGVDKATAPVGRWLVRRGVTADVLTASGLVFAVATAAVVATGHLIVGIPLLALTGFHDLFDGPVAKAAGTASVRGALFDSVVDRVTDAVLMAGVAWYLVSAHDGEVALLPLGVLGAAALVSYVRAKAEGLGLPVTNSGIFGGLMERAERMILLGVGFLEPWLLVPVLWVLFGLTVLTAAARFATAWRAADGPNVAAARAARPGTRVAGMPIPGWRERRAGARSRPRRAEEPAAGDVTAEWAARWRARRREALDGRTARARARRERRDRRVARFGAWSGPGPGRPGASDRGT